MRGVFEFVVRRKPQVPAIRKLVSVARDSKLLDPIEAARIVTVLGRAPDSPSVAHGWPTFLAVPDYGSLICKRALAILSVPKRRSRGPRRPDSLKSKRPVCARGTNPTP